LNSQKSPKNESFADLTPFKMLKNVMKSHYFVKTIAKMSFYLFFYYIYYYMCALFHRRFKMKKCLILMLAFCAIFFSCSSEDKNSEGLGKTNAEFGLCKGSPLESHDAIAEDTEPSVIVADGKTQIHLPSVNRPCSTSLEIKAAKSNDTLKLEYYLPEGKDYIMSKCMCVSDLDLTIESVENDIKNIILGNGSYKIKNLGDVSCVSQGNPFDCHNTKNCYITKDGATVCDVCFEDSLDCNRRACFPEPNDIRPDEPIYSCSSCASDSVMYVLDSIFQYNGETINGFTGNVITREDYIKQNRCPNDSAMTYFDGMTM
jgi:hypothetical protein